MVLEVAMVPGKQHPVASAPTFVGVKGQIAAGTASELVSALAPGFSGQSANPTGRNFYFVLPVGNSPGIRLSQRFSYARLPRPFSDRTILLILYEPLRRLCSLNCLSPARRFGEWLKEQYMVVKSRSTWTGRALETPTRSVRISRLGRM